MVLEIFEKMSKNRKFSVASDFAKATGRRKQPNLKLFTFLESSRSKDVAFAKNFEIICSRSKVIGLWRSWVRISDCAESVILLAVHIFLEFRPNLIEFVSKEARTIKIHSFLIYLLIFVCLLSLGIFIFVNLRHRWVIFKNVLCNWNFVI